MAYQGGEPELYEPRHSEAHILSELGWSLRTEWIQKLTAIRILRTQIDLA